MNRARIAWAVCAGVVIASLGLAGCEGMTRRQQNTAAGAAILAFGLTFFLEELPLANTLRKEPEAEIDAEEAATAAIVGAPAAPSA